MSFLRMQNIAKRFGATIALDGVSLEVNEGEVHALVGENGSGKSTLMRVLAGALKQDSGEMFLADKPYLPRTPMEARLAGVAMIHQELTICPHLSIAENVMLGMEDAPLGFTNRSSMHDRAHAALKKLGYGDLDVEKSALEIPLATRQVVEIARAVAVGSKLVVLDEPTSSLTEADALKLFDIVETLRNQGHAIIYISHFLDEIDRLADRMTILRDGNNVGTRIKGDVTTDEIVSMMVGREIESMYPRSVRTPGKEILKIESVHGRSKPVNASLTLRRGEVVGVAGLNGSGRTELLRTVFGLDPIRSGDVKLGVHVGAASPARRWAEGAGMLSEDRKSEGLALSMSIADNTTLTALERFGGGLLVSPSKQEAESRKWIEKLAVKCQGPTQAVGELSGGNQQKVALARLLFHGVDVLLLDEPTRGIDVGSKETIYRLIDEAALQGKAVLVVSSYLPELLGVCDRIAVMHKGVLGEAKPIEGLTAEEIIREAVGA